MRRPRGRRHPDIIYNKHYEWMSVPVDRAVGHTCNEPRSKVLPSRADGAGTTILMSIFFNRAEETVDTVDDT